MIDIIYLTPCLFVFYVVLIKCYFVVATRFKILDIPNNRSSHLGSTIRGGGIIFPIAGFIGLCLSSSVEAYVLVGLVMISLISFIDDIVSLSSKQRLLFQLMSCVLLLIQFWDSSFVWVTPFLLVVMIAMINAYNFMDGVNGMNGLYSFSFLLGMLGVFWLDSSGNLTLIVSLGLSVVVFGYFNFRKKAVCFSGDVGSVAMAFLVLYFLIFHINENGSYLLILMLLLYGLDTFWTVMERALNKEKITEAHRKHLYQLLVNELGMSHLSISLFYFFIQLLINVLILFWLKHDLNQMLLFSVLVVFGSVLYLVIKGFVKRKIIANESVL